MDNTTTSVYLGETVDNSTSDPSNATDAPSLVDPTLQAHRAALTLAMTIFLSVNMAAGLVGNSLSLAVFTRSRLSGAPSSGYLAALAVVDSGTLVMALLYEVLERVDHFTRMLHCLIVPFFMEVFMFLSAWFVVAFTAERSVAVCHPLHAPRILAKVRERRVVAILVVLGAALYSYYFWAKNLDSVCQDQGGDLDQFYRLTGYLRFGFNFALPFVLIVALNVAIVIGLRREQTSRSRESVRSTSSQTAWKNSQQITKTLLLVSVAFLVLNVPYRSMQLAYGGFGARIFDPLLELWIDFCSYVFLCFNYSVNFVFYALSGSRFRKSLAELTCKGC